MPIQRKGMRALQIWCQRVTKDYDNVEIIDLSSSFRNGLAFCAIIHHFRPELIDYDSLKPEDVFENNDLAYRVAEDKLNIPSLLEAQDMVESEMPDKFSVVTYVSQFYHLFKDEDGSRSPNVSLLSRSSESENDSLLLSSAESTPLGTPTITPKRIFHQADLIEKYGEEIFASSKKSSVGYKSTVSTVCEDMALKAKISEEKES